MCISVVPIQHKKEGSVAQLESARPFFCALERVRIARNDRIEHATIIRCAGNDLLKAGMPKTKDAQAPRVHRRLPIEIGTERSSIGGTRLIDQPRQPWNAVDRFTPPSRSLARQIFGMHHLSIE